MVSKRLMISNQEQYQKHYKFMQNYKPLNDYITEQQLSKDTKYKYYGTLAAYCCSQDEYFNKLIEEAQNEEKSNIPLAERKVHKRLDVYKEFLKEEGYIDKTIDRRVKIVRSFYRKHGVTLIENNRTLELNPKLREEIKNSTIFKRFVATLNLENESTIGGYLTSLTGYCDYYNMSIEELIEEADKEEEANVRFTKRKVKTRLIEYRSHLAKHYANSTIKTKMSDITYFYVINDIEIPKLPKSNYPYEPELSFDEIPTLNHVKRALETTTSIKNRALILFCLTSGSSAHEARSLTLEEYMLGTKECHGETTDIKKALEKMEGNMEFVPVFHLVREKKKRDYYTCITPEANQYIINYLKTRDQLTLKDKVFDYSRKSLINAFEHINDTNNWGWVNNNRQRMFTCHQLRRLNANIIDNGKLVHMIQGKKFDPTVRAYFKQDPKKVRAKYTNEVRKLTIYEKYKTYTLTDENYAEMQEKLDEKDTIIEQQAEQIKTLEESQSKLDNTVEDLSKRLKELDKQLKHLDDEEHSNKEVYDTIFIFSGYLLGNPSIIKDREFISELNINENIFNKLNEEKDKIYNTPTGKQMRTMNGDEINTINEIAYELAMNDRNFKITVEQLNKLFKKALFKLKRNPDLIIKVKNYIEEIENRVEQSQKFNNIFNVIINEINIWDKEEVLSLRKEISIQIEQTISSEEELTKEIIMDLIEDHL